MEEIKKLLEENEYYSDWSNGSDSQDESIDNNVGIFANAVSIFKGIDTDLNTNTLNSKRQSGKERLPTRRPDPNVYNRNALLARENRRKKKVYLETIEKELYVARKANRVLMKALKRQMKKAHRLEREKEHFKRLIGKGNDLLGIGGDLNTPSLTKTEAFKSFSESSSNDDLNLLSSEERYDLTGCRSNILEGETRSADMDYTSTGTINNVLNNPFDFQPFPDFFTDFENSNIWRNNSNNTDDLSNPEFTILHKNNVLDVNIDHCYVLKTSVDKKQEVNSQTNKCLGLIKTCLPQTHGEFGEMFCPRYILSAESKSLPLQLLNDD